MRIVFLTHRNARDKREWSGTLHYMARSLEKHAGEVIHVGPYHPFFPFLVARIIRKLTRLLLRRNYSFSYNLIIVWAFRMHFSRKIRKIKPDIVFAAAASPEMSYLNTNIPIVYLGDITFKLLKESYPNYQNLTRCSDRESEHVENRTFRRAEALILSSSWASESAMHDYQVPERKINLISYGANMDRVPSIKEIGQKKINGSVRLLFLGTDWERKGGDIVLKTFRILRDKGLDFHLTVCGCTPPDGYNQEGITVIPFLNKNEENDAKRLYDLLLDSHFMFVPSRSDCTPIVFCEANAFGLPVITSNVGGITSVIEDGINGRTLDIASDPGQFAGVLEHFALHPDQYGAFVQSSRKAYDEKLNWDRWGTEVRSVFEGIVNKKANNSTE